MAKFLDISIEELREVLGHETKSKYGTYYFRCPECAKYGKDTKGDNLVFNSNNGKLRCFGCGEGQYKVLGLINEIRKKNGYWSVANCEKKQNLKKQREEQAKKPLWYEINKEELLQYQWEAEQELLEAKPIIEWLCEKHGISEQTISDCGIGLDADKNAVCFPIYSIQHEQMLVGFEYRLLGEKKQIWRTPDTPSGIATIWGRMNAPYLIFLEGYLDCYCFKQFLEKKGLADKYLILTPANGANDLLKNLNKIDFSNYKTCYLLLDNDNVGDAVTQEILEQYPFFIDKREVLRKNNVKDMKDYYKLKYL